MKPSGPVTCCTALGPPPVHQLFATKLSQSQSAHTHRYRYGNKSRPPRPGPYGFTTRLLENSKPYRCKTRCVQPPPPHSLPPLSHRAARTRHSHIYGFIENSAQKNTSRITVYSLQLQGQWYVGMSEGGRSMAGGWWEVRGGVRCRAARAVVFTHLRFLYYVFTLRAGLSGELEWTRAHTSTSVTFRADAASSGLS